MVYKLMVSSYLVPVNVELSRLCAAFIFIHHKIALAIINLLLITSTRNDYIPLPQTLTVACLGNQRWTANVVALMWKPNSFTEKYKRHYSSLLNPRFQRDNLMKYKWKVLIGTTVN